MRRSSQSFVALAVALAALLAAPQPAQAQLDPLLFLKIQAPNIILVVETTNRMQRDADLTYYDPADYETDSSWALTLGLEPSEYSAPNGKHRRKFLNLTHITPGNSTDPKFETSHIDAVGDKETGYGSFYERTRLAIARRGLTQAISDNATSARFSLVKTRQSLAGTPIPNSPNDVTNVLDPAQVSDTDASNGRWKLTRPAIQGSTSNYASPQSTAWVTRIGDSNATSNILSTLAKNVSQSGALIPAGDDNSNSQDTPIGLMMDDARAEAARLIALDTSGCRNTVVVMIVAGGEGHVPGSVSADLATKASQFLNVSGRRVPIYLIAVTPAAADVASLTAIATTSGGEYIEITKQIVESTLTGSFYVAGQPLPEVVHGINRAIQHTFIQSTLFNTTPTVALPTGPQEEFQVTSPIVGTVNLKGAQGYDRSSGALTTLPDTETEISHEGQVVPQRSNVLVSSGFALPGFDARLHALRVYRPEPDATKPSGYRFVQDGTRLWTASTPVAASRNIYTILPNSTTPIKFEVANVNTLSPYLRANDPSSLIDWIRSQPLGAVLDSTPAFLDPPSLDPPPDADYPGFVDDLKDRRSLVFVGLNDGMLHAIDSRTGVEVWAFIPFNLLPKLKSLRYGQSLDAFKYFVDSSPKIADVKVADSWRTYLFFGQGPGGTFYTALDVTLAGLSGIAIETAPVDTVVSYFTSADRITVNWTFPRNSSFDATIAPYGDVSAAATAVEKTVGETWSDPAIGQLTNETGPFVMLTGSGFMKRSLENQPNRDNGAILGGRTFYVIDVATGNVLASRDVGSDSAGESDDSCRAANNCSRLKNALQMDPVATGQADSRFVSRVYIGDLDGNVWRFDVSGSPTSVSLPAPTKLYGAGASHPLFASMATVNVGGSKQYVFVGTGSDLLPSNGVNQSYKMLIVLDNGGSGTLTAEVLLEETDGLAGDEKVTAFPAVAGDIVFFTTTTTIPAQVCSPFVAALYAFTFIGGPAYDTNNDGRFTTDATSGKGKGKGGGGGGGGGGSSDSVLATEIAGARATAPFIVDQHLVFSAGGKIEMFGDPEDFNNGVGQAGVRILSWRLVR